MTTPKNIIGKTAKCVLKEGSTEKQLDKSLPVCANVKDEIHVNLTNAQISNDTVSLVDGKLVRRIVISGVSTGENFNNGEKDKYKLLIMEKFNNLNFPTSDKVSIAFSPAIANSPNTTITLSFNVDCGNSTMENACTYVNGEWKQNTRYTFNNNLKMTQEQFNTSCANQLVNCDLQQSCELGSLKTISTCSDANNEVYEADIVKKHNTNNPLSKSCVDAFGERLPLGFNPADIKQETTKMIYSKTCGINNSFEELCTKEGQFKLLRKIKQCIPPNNSECKSQVCLEFTPDFKSKLNVSYRPNPSNPSTGTKTITVDIVEGNPAYLSTPEFRQFVAESIGVNDSATIDLQGRRLIITINYNCGTLDKTYENNGECLYENNNWIKRYEQSYKNSENIDAAAMEQHCRITNKRVTEDCDQAISCEIQQDTSVPNTCENGEQRIVYNIVKKNSKSGNDCLSMARARNATYNFIVDGNKVVGNKACYVTPSPTPSTQNVDCQVSDWGDCTKTCGGGTRTRQVTVAKQGNGRSCPPLSESCNTQACPTQDTTPPNPPTPSTQNVDCQVTDWGDCTKTCGGGTRSRQVLVNRQGNGRDCPSLLEVCNMQACPTEEKKKEDDKSNMMLILIVVFMFLIIMGLGVFLMLRKK